MCSLMYDFYITIFNRKTNTGKSSAFQHAGKFMSEKFCFSQELACYLTI